VKSSGRCFDPHRLCYVGLSRSFHPPVQVAGSTDSDAVLTVGQPQGSLTPYPWRASDSEQINAILSEPRTPGSAHILKDPTHSSIQPLDAKKYKGLRTHSPICSVDTIDQEVPPGLWDISGNVGLVSAGRINKDTPPLTTPGYTSKSSAMDTSSHIFQIIIHKETQRHFRPRVSPCLV
jgi:hypothetical protein